MRSEQERREAAEKQVSETMEAMLSETKVQMMNSVGSISLTELKRLAVDQEYEEDSRMTSNHYVTINKHKDGLEDQALRTATENIKQAEDLEGDLQIYKETVHPLYVEQRDKTAALIEQVEAKQQLFTRESLVKSLKGVANEKYKEGRKATQTFSKGTTMSKDEYLQQFLESRKKYYEMMQYAEIVHMAAESGQ